MGRLKKAGIPVYLLHGNHDSESTITKRLDLSDDVHVFSAQKPETFELKDLNVALHGQSFQQRDVIENLIPGYPGPFPGAFNMAFYTRALAAWAVTRITPRAPSRTRPDDSVVPVSGMSAGTADQLNLALRVASIEDYLERADALPFVADDLFINFDDDRAAAGHRLLGQLVEKTQVLFFTHHQHLVDIAKATLGLPSAVCR